MKILQVNSGIRGAESNSTKLADKVSARLKTLAPEAELEVRDLADQPFLDAAALGALFTPAEKRSSEQAKRVAVDDATIAQLLAADVLVLGVPLYNLGVPVQLKAWIDAVSRAGTTFRYTAEGPVGLVTGKKVFVALARGGIYHDTPMDAQTPYLRTVLSFLGMSDITFVHAEGLNISPEVAETAWAQAQAEIDALAL
jgi:FMN-dependent NADH-azoreductase